MPEARPPIPSPKEVFAALGALEAVLCGVPAVEDCEGENSLLAVSGEIFKFGLVRLRRSVSDGESGWGELLAWRLPLPLG